MDGALGAPMGAPGLVSAEPVEYHSRDKVVLVPFEALVISAVTRAGLSM